MNMVLETLGLTKQYSSGYAVNDLHLKVEQGQIYGLLGRNGAGKTTTMRMITGLLQPTGGDILLFGKKMIKPTRECFCRIGAFIESPAFYENLTAAENLKIIADLRGTQRKNAIEEALVLVELEKEGKKKVKQYSLGMKQRLGLAMAMMHHPEFLILDEPTNGLDPLGIQQIRQLLKKLSAEEGVTILISSHILSEIEQMADKVGIIDHGVLLEELTMTEIRRRNRHFLKLTVTNAAKAVPLLEKNLAVKDFEILNDHEIKIYDMEQNPEKINLTLVSAGIGVSELTLKKGNLEEYFLKLTGGELLA